MRLIKIIVLVFTLLPALLQAQKESTGTFPDIKRFSATLDYLSSNWMEGREAGEKGGLMAADFIETLMRWADLKSCGDVSVSGQRSYFQDFDVIRYKTQTASLALLANPAATDSYYGYREGIDFEVITAPRNSFVRAPVVFTGYGISAPDLGYDDYKGIDVNNRIVLVLPDFPGHNDTTSAAWKRFAKPLESACSTEEKVKTAAGKGALAVVVLSLETGHSFKHKVVNEETVANSMIEDKFTDAAYEDWDYCLQGDKNLPLIPCLAVTPEVAAEIMQGSGLLLEQFVKKMAAEPKASSFLLKNRELKLSVEVDASPVRVRNVLGYIPGTDTNHCVVIGAHYDHLGKRNGLIYNGADDNASGVSGVMALASGWSASGIKPPVNLVFATWTAEEKGLLGSNYFVHHPVREAGNIRFYLNMDMISRNDPADSAHQQISIGTRTGDEYLRQIARNSNSLLNRPFLLDLWDVMGHSGSDYASFTAGGIPVMSFFSGFHPDYHSPRDVAARADLEKSAAILRLVDNCLKEVLKQIDK